MKLMPGILIAEKKFNFDGYKLTPTWYQFAMMYLDKTKPYYLNGAQTYLAMGKKPKNMSVARRGAQNILAKPEVERLLRDRLSQGSVTDLLEEGLIANLKNHKKTESWVKVARYASEIRGDFAPIKTVSLTLTADDRQKEFDEILQLIEGTSDKLPELHGVHNSSPEVTPKDPDKENDPV